MKYVKLFEQFVNEVKYALLKGASKDARTRDVEESVDSLASIEIVSMRDTGVSNTSRTKTTKNFKEIKEYLLDSDWWTDDVTFKDKKGKLYFIDDLIGQKVKLGKEIISVEESLL